MTINEQDREILVRRRIEKAREALSDATFLVEGERYSAAVNRI